MKLKVGEALEVSEHLSKLLKIKMNVVPSYKLGVFLKKIADEVEVFNKARTELFEKYGEKTENEIQVKPENVEAFTKEIKPLVELYVEHEFEPISIKEMFNGKENSEIEPEIFFVLHKLFKE